MNTKQIFLIILIKFTPNYEKFRNENSKRKTSKLTFGMSVVPTTSYGNN